MSKHKYGMQKNVQNDLQQCINSFERMKRGGIGIADELVCDTCKRALKYIDELEDKLAESEPVRHGRWIYNPNGMDFNLGAWECSVCTQKNNNLPCNRNISPYICVGSKYGPTCGAKMDKTE